MSRMGTGKAVGSVITEKSPKIFAATQEDALLKQQNFINNFLHPQARRCCSNLRCSLFPLISARPLRP